MAFLVGSACLSTLVFFLSALHLIYKPVFLAIALLVMAAGIRQGVWRSSGDSLPVFPAGWRLVFYSIYSLFAVVYLICAFAPEADGFGGSPVRTPCGARFGCVRKIMDAARDVCKITCGESPDAAVNRNVAVG